MAGHYLRKRLRSAGFARRAASFALILLVIAALVFRLKGVDFETFAILLGIVGGLATLAFLLALGGLVRVWRSGHAGGGTAIVALVIAGLVGAPYALAGALALRNPPTNMAETDGIAEEESDAASDAAGAAPIDTDDALSGRIYAARASQIYQAVRLVLGDVEWTVSDVETADPEEDAADGDVGASDGVPPSITGPIPVPTPRSVPGEEGSGEAKAPDPLDRPESGEYRITAVASSPILALPSDVEIRIVEDDAQGYLDLKSVSRFGARDFGQNRRFIEDFLARVDTAMVGTVSPAGS